MPDDCGLCNTSRLLAAQNIKTNQISVDRSRSVLMWLSVKLEVKRFLSPRFCNDSVTMTKEPDASQAERMICSLDFILGRFLITSLIQVYLTGRHLDTWPPLTCCLLLSLRKMFDFAEMPTRFCL